MPTRLIFHISTCFSASSPIAALPQRWLCRLTAVCPGLAFGCAPSSFSGLHVQEQGFGRAGPPML